MYSMTSCFRQLQCILLKVSLLLGVEVFEGVSFEDTIEPVDQVGGQQCCGSGFAFATALGFGSPNFYIGRIRQHEKEAKIT